MARANLCRTKDIEVPVTTWTQDVERPTASGINNNMLSNGTRSPSSRRNLCMMVHKTLVCLAAFWWIVFDPLPYEDRSHGPKPDMPVGHMPNEPNTPHGATSHHFDPFKAMHP